MTIDEARALVKSRRWTEIRDRYLESGVFDLYSPKLREAVEHIDEWTKIVDGAKVRELKEKFVGIYPEILRYRLYLKSTMSVEEKLEKLLEVWK